MGKPDPRQVPLVKLATAPNEPVAMLWRGLLEAEGIPCVVKTGGPGPADFNVVVCPHHLWVLAPHLKRARRLLEAINGE